MRNKPLEVEAHKTSVFFAYAKAMRMIERVTC